jgi:hypothetical protein
MFETVLGVDEVREGDEWDVGLHSSTSVVWLTSRGKSPA